MKLMKDAVLETAKRLCKANGKVTTLELKAELRTTHPNFYWIQNNNNAGVTGVSDYMVALQSEGYFTYTDNGIYRTYSLAKKNTIKKAPKSKNDTNSINSQKALILMKDNKGHFFTATFVKQNGEERKINCKYIRNQSSSTPGYVMVKEAVKMKEGVNPIRQINLQTLKNIRIGGKNYNVK